MIESFKLIFAVVMAAGLFIVSQAPVSAATLTSPVEIVVGANPGGGYDRMARAIEGVVKKKQLINTSMNITYHPGGGGAVAWARINEYPGDMTKLSIFSPNIITNQVLRASKESFENLTMIATLVFEDACFAVNPNGRIKNARGLVHALKTDPQDLRFGFAVAAGNQWHVAMALLADAVGTDIKKVRTTVFSSGAKARVALLGEHTDVSVSGCATFAKYHQAGSLRIVAIAAPKRASGIIADVPTWRELGYNVVWAAWRGVLAPKGLKADQIKFWEDKLRAVVESPEWKPVEQKNFWRTKFLDHEQTIDLMKNSLDQYRKTLRKIGLIK